MMKSSYISSARLRKCMLGVSIVFILIVLVVSVWYTIYFFTKCDETGIESDNTITPNDSIIYTTLFPDWRTTTPGWNRPTTTEAVPKKAVCDSVLLLIIVWIAMIVFIFLLVSCGYAWYNQGCCSLYDDMGYGCRDRCRSLGECGNVDADSCSCKACCCGCFGCLYLFTFWCVPERVYDDLDEEDCCFINCGVLCCVCFCCYVPHCCETIINEQFENIDEHERALNKHAMGGFKMASKEEHQCIEALIKLTKIHDDVTVRDAINLTHTDIEIMEVWKNTKSKRKYNKNLKTMRNIEFPGDLPPIKTSTLTSTLLRDKLRLNTDKEVLLFHGTKIDTMQNVMSKGFNMKYASNYSLFGRGLYFAESYQKSDQYVDDQNDRREERLTMILARVALGKVNMTDQDHRDKPFPEGFDSAIAAHERARHRRRFREFIVTNEKQCFPEYVIIYKRVSKF